MLADEEPAPGMFVSVALATTRGNAFGVGLGPTDERGELVVLRSDLLRDAGRAELLEALRCGHPERDFAGEIVVRPLDREALARACAAYAQYQHTALYLPSYATRLAEARSLLDRWRPRTLRTEVYIPAGRALACGAIVTA